MFFPLTWLLYKKQRQSTCNGEPACARVRARDAQSVDTRHRIPSGRRISATPRNKLLGGDDSNRHSFREVGEADNLLLGGGYTKVVRGIWMCASNYSAQVRGPKPTAVTTPCHRSHTQTTQSEMEFRSAHRARAGAGEGP